MTFTEPETCRLCGHPDKRDLTYRLAHWREAPPGMAYEHIPACRDYAACHARLTASGKQWPLVETSEARTA